MAIDHDSLYKELITNFFNAFPKEVSLFKLVRPKVKGKGEMNFGWALDQKGDLVI